MISLKNIPADNREEWSGTNVIDAGWPPLLLLGIIIAPFGQVIHVHLVYGNKIYEAAM